MLVITSTITTYLPPCLGRLDHFLTGRKCNSRKFGIFSNLFFSIHTVLMYVSFQNENFWRSFCPWGKCGWLVKICLAKFPLYSALVVPTIAPPAASFQSSLGRPSNSLTGAWSGCFRTCWVVSMCCSAAWYLKRIEALISRPHFFPVLFSDYSEVKRHNGNVNVRCWQIQAGCCRSKNVHLHLGQMQLELYNWCTPSIAQTTRKPWYFW